MIMFLFFTFWALIFCWHWVILFLAACKTLLKFWERKTTVKKCTLFSGSNWKVLSKSALAASQSLRARCASPKYRTWAKATDSNVHLCGTKPWRHSHSLQLPAQSQSFTQSASKIHHMTPDIYQLSTLSQTPRASIHWDILRWHIARLSRPAWRSDFLSSSASPFREISCSRKSITCAKHNFARGTERVLCLKPIRKRVEAGVISDTTTHLLIPAGCNLIFQVLQQIVIVKSIIGNLWQRLALKCFVPFSLKMRACSSFCSASSWTRDRIGN